MPLQMARQIPQRESLWDPLGDLLGPVLQLMSQSDLHALSLVSKASRATTEPFLYSKIEWTWLRDQVHPIALFLRTILRRPELASYVRSVALLGDLTLYISDNGMSRCRGGPYWGDRLPKVSIIGLDVDNAVEAIEAARVSYSHRWEQELRGGAMDAFVALLLSQLHNLKHLVLSQSNAKQNRLMGMLLYSALCEKGGHGLPTFKHLREVAFELTDYQDRKLCGENTADVLPFFYLPDVQYLSVSLDNPVAFSWPTSMPPKPSTITSLNLTLVREAHLSGLLSVTPLLKTLRWVFYYSKLSKHASNTSLVDLDVLGTALTQVRSTLEELSISTNPNNLGSDLDPPPLDIRGALIALVDFSQLEKLQIPLQFLTASFVPATGIQLKDVVPRNIRSLIITDDLEEQYEQNEWDDAALYSIIALWLQDLMDPKPNLRTVSLLLNYTDSDWGPSMRQALTELCYQHGFEAKVTKAMRDM